MITADRFVLNPSPTVAERRVGGGKIVVVDDFYEDPAAVRALQDEVGFSSDRAVVHNFPGERALVDADIAHLNSAVAGHFGVPEPPDGTTGAKLNLSRYRAGVALAPSQRMPHTDATLTALVYLNTPEECAGGTGFYRHRSTGLDLIPMTPSREVIRIAASLGYRARHFEQMGYPGVLERMFFSGRFAPEENRFINDGNRTWELLERVDMRFNRLLIYDGRIPHGIWADPADFHEVPRVCQLLSISLDAVVAAPASA